MKLFSEELKILSKEFKIDERMVWTKIDGLPLYAWTSRAFQKVASELGDVIFIVEDKLERISMGKVCI